MRRKTFFNKFLSIWIYPLGVLTWWKNLKSAVSLHFCQYNHENSTKIQVITKICVVMGRSLFEVGGDNDLSTGRGWPQKIDPNFIYMSFVGKGNVIYLHKQKNYCYFRQTGFSQQNIWISIEIGKKSKSDLKKQNFVEYCKCLRPPPCWRFSRVVVMRRLCVDLYYLYKNSSSNYDINIMVYSWKVSYDSIWLCAPLADALMTLGATPPPPCFYLLWFGLSLSKKTR